MHIHTYSHTHTTDVHTHTFDGSYYSVRLIDMLCVHGKLVERWLFYEMRSERSMEKSSTTAQTHSRISNDLFSGTPADASNTWSIYDNDEKEGV